MAAKKSSKKSAPARSARPSSSAGTAGSSNRARSKGEVFRNIADETGLTRKQVSDVFDSMRGMIEKDLSKKGPGVFAVPGLMRLKAIYKPATKATTKANPFKPGEMMTVKAKPARTKIRISPVKALKDSL